MCMLCKHVLLCVFVITGVIFLSRVYVGFGFVTFSSEEVVDKLCSVHFLDFKEKKVGCRGGDVLVCVECVCMYF